MIDPMMNLNPKVVTDENGTPTAVQIPYADWLRLEGYLAAVTDEAASEKTPASETDDSKGKEPTSSASTPPSAHPPADPELDREARSSDSDDRTGVGPQLDELLRARSSKGEKMRQRLQQEWEHLDDEATEPSPDARADIDDDFEEALEEARGSLSEEDADHGRAIRDQWDQL